MERGQQVHRMGRCNVADFSGYTPLRSSARRFSLSQVDLSAKGLGEAKSAGSLLKSEGIKVDMAFTSYLKRAWVKGNNARQQKS